MQTIIDKAVEAYGNSEAVPVLIEDNAFLFAIDREFEITADMPDVSLVVRDEDDVKDKKVLKELDGNR
jgi:hypothetical protein